MMKKTKKASLKKAETKNTTALKRKITNVNMAIGFMAVVIGLLGYLFVLTKQVNDLRDNPVALGFIVTEAVDGLNKAIPVHAETGNIFISEARLVLPPSPQDRGEFVYHYSAKDETNLEEVTIASKTLINQAKVTIIGAKTAKESINLIPKLQSCARGYKFYFVEKTDFAGTKVVEKTLNDGRKIYAYQEDGCTDQRDEIVDYLRQIQSY